MVYEMVPGTNTTYKNTKKLNLMTHGLANYHLAMKKFPEKNMKEKMFLGSLKKKFNDIKAIKSRSKINLLAKENIDFMIMLFNKIKSKKFEENILPVHMDFHGGNLVYEKNKLVGIIDFDNIVFAPRIRDIAHLIKTSVSTNEKKFSKEVEFMLNEYSSINPLTKKEKVDVWFILARDCCIMFEYFYSHKGIGCLEWTISVAKGVNREITKLSK
jgi:Ser/Thr protein kinase RdoA (MazF antagonist)